MASTTPTPSRRAMLGSIAAMGAAVAIAAPLAAPAAAYAVSAPGTADWDRAMSAYQTAKAASEPVWARYRAAPAGSASEAALLPLVERLCDRLEVAEDTLWAMPAPHRDALLWKLEYLLAVDEEGSTPSWSRKFAQPVIDDMRRLLAAPAA